MAEAWESSDVPHKRSGSAGLDRQLMELLSVTQQPDNVPSVGPQRPRASIMRHHLSRFVVDRTKNLQSKALLDDVHFVSFVRTAVCFVLELVSNLYIRIRALKGHADDMYQAVFPQTPDSPSCITTRVP
jgi:hypothetical protein